MPRRHTTLGTLRLDGFRRLRGGGGLVNRLDFNPQRWWKGRNRLSLPEVGWFPKGVSRGREAGQKVVRHGCTWAAHGRVAGW